MLFVYLLIILVSFALMGGIFFTILRNNYLEAQMDIMVENLHEINDWVNSEGCEDMSDIDFYTRLIEKADKDDTMLWFISNDAMVYMVVNPH